MPSATNTIIPPRASFPAGRSYLTSICLQLRRACSPPPACAVDLGQRLCWHPFPRVYLELAVLDRPPTMAKRSLVWFIPPVDGGDLPNRRDKLLYP
jgi:hypothetical protein